MLSSKKIFTAVVITSNSGSGAVTVARESYGTSTSADVGMNMQGMVVSHTLGNYLGFKETILPQPGSRVICVENNASSCFVLGIIPWENLGSVELPARNTLGAGNPIESKSNRVGHQQYTPLVFDQSRSSDNVDGEHVISNEFGVLLGLFQQFATLKASELAQIQCFLLDDMVRIVSHNYQHFTALGEFNITHDGKRLLAEFGATHKVAETYGTKAITSDTGDGAKFKEGGGDSPDDSSDYYKLDGDKQVKAINRFKMFVGSISDFVNFFICRPSEKDEDTSPETGLLSVHTGVDGGLHVRSTKEVFIEKTNWIRVPKRIASPEDPNGDDAAEIKYDEKKKFKFDNTFKNRQAQQIRDYVAYVNQKLTYQNFKKHEKDFFVNDDYVQEFTLGDKTQLDQEIKEAGFSVAGTAGIYLMPNGGITIRDGFNSAIVMENGNIYFQAARDLHAQPSKDCIFKVGQNLSMAAQTHVDISASTGGLRLKSQQTMYLHSAEGGMIFESLASRDNVPYSPEQNSEKVEPEEYEYIDPADNKKKTEKDQTPQPIKLTSGIIFKSNTGIYSFAESNILNKSKYLYNEIEKQINNTSELIVDYGKNQIMRMSDNTILDYTPGLWGAVAEGAAYVSGNPLSLGQYKKPINVIGPKLQGVLKINQWKRQSKIKKFKKSREELLKYTMFKKNKDTGKYPIDFIKFRFLKSPAYKFDLFKDTISSTSYQQKKGSESAWSEQKINDSQPYPGAQVWSSFYLSSDGFKNLSEMPQDKITLEEYDKSNPPVYENADSQPEAIEIRLTGLDDYAVIGKPAEPAPGGGENGADDEPEEEDPDESTGDDE